MDKNTIFATAMLKSDNTWYYFEKPYCLGEFDNVQPLNKDYNRDYYFCYYDYKDFNGRDTGRIYFVQK